MSKQARKEGDTDLVRLWEDHIRHEFETRSTDDTLDTMVEDAYVDHVPVLTGGSGKAELREFYATHFIPRMPPDLEMVPISDDREGSACRRNGHHVYSQRRNGLDATGHPADWPAGGSRPRRDRPIPGWQIGPRAYLLGPSLSVAQLGLLDPQKLPIAGVESAKKVLDPALPANALIQRA